MAMIGYAPASRSPSTTLSPTPPRPKMAVDVPGCTLAVFTTAPTPVMTAQPNSAAISSEYDLSIFISDSGAATVNSE